MGIIVNAIKDIGEDIGKTGLGYEGTACKHNTMSPLA